ncbi:hypothetical protein [Nocardioides sp. AX2bis]|uniref:hypothetical protein n=1 Tax=Nocardioides sp. AX2bis TaxID=2653157 RepID=UPI00135CDE17|nr:hypothetical protein [Nocardioides sp. AX2bis]
MDDHTDNGGRTEQTIGTAAEVENRAGQAWHPGQYAPSPVPSDERLWPGELPFTAFGQLGVDRLDLRVFDQDQWWVDRTGTPHLLQDMSVEYLGNVIEFLLEHRDGFYADTIRRWFVQSLGDQLLFDEPGGELLAAVAGGPDWDEVAPEEWLESTPLMRKLRRSVTVEP